MNTVSLMKAAELITKTSGHYLDRSHLHRFIHEGYVASWAFVRQGRVRQLDVRWVYSFAKKYRGKERSGDHWTYKHEGTISPLHLAIKFANSTPAPVFDPLSL